MIRANQVKTLKRVYYTSPTTWSGRTKTTQPLGIITDPKQYFFKLNTGMQLEFRRLSRNLTTGKAKDWETMVEAANSLRV